MSIANIEQTIRDEIIEDLNADTTTSASKSEDKVNAWGVDPPNTRTQYPYGYVKFVRRDVDPEHTDIFKFSYVFTFELGVAQRRQKEINAENFVLDMLAKAETVIRKNLTLGDNVQNLAFGYDKDSRDLDTSTSWIIMMIQFRKSLDASL